MPNEEPGLKEKIIYFTTVTVEKTQHVKRSSQFVVACPIFYFISSTKENDKWMENFDKRGIKPTMFGDFALVS